MLLGCCILLFLLWLPGVHYPIVSDTAVYAVLGQNLWQHGTYSFFGEPYAKQLPLYAFLSYPFVHMLGYGLGMKVSSLIAGFGVLVVTSLLLTKTMGRNIALATVLLLTLHHGFVLMAQLGSADLLFAAFFLFAVYAYVRAGEEKSWYLSAFVLAGLASLTRYNGIPLFALFGCHTVLRRRSDVFSRLYLLGLGLGLGIAGSWFLRNFLVFGNPFYNEYTGELAQESLGFFQQVVSNVIFYAHPMRNILPVLLLGAVIGLWKEGKKQGFLVFVMLTAWLLTSFWWVQGMRFAFPGYPILIGFGVCGLFAVCRGRHRLGYLVIAALLLSHVSALCLYSYGACNAWFDRTVGILPKNMGLSSEGFYTWSLARDYINEHAEERSFVDASSKLLAHVWQESVFRKDLQVVEHIDAVCPAYRIAAEPVLRQAQDGSRQAPEPEGGEVVFATQDAPQWFVVYYSCE